MGMVMTLGVPLPVGADARKRMVKDLVQEGYSSAPALRERLSELGVVNVRTGKPFSLSTLRNDLQTTRARNGSAVRELIGREVYADPLWKLRQGRSVDATQGDYEFWDRLRRGQAEGFKFGGLFCMPLTQIISSYVFGDGVKVRLASGVDGPEDRVEYTNELLAHLSARLHPVFLAMAVDLYGLGDQYLVVNPDTSVSVVSPELATIVPNELDYREVEQVKVTSRLPKYTVTDTYSRSQRRLVIEQTDAQKRTVADLTFENLIGRLPIIHFANDRGGNELYGRPIYEALYRLFSRYDDLLEKSLDGAELIGNPMPAFEGVEDIDETIDANATIEDETYTDAEGNEQTRKVLRWDTLGVVILGKGGQFNFKGPAVGFTSDVRDMLKSLFLLLLDYTRVPEAVWGGAIASSKASAETQVPSFLQYIVGRRVALEGAGADPELGTEAEGGLHEFFDVWLRTRALTDPRLLVGPVQFSWPELSEANMDLLLKWVQYLRGTGALTSETALTLFGKVDDPQAELEAAEKEALEAQQREREALDSFRDELRDAQDRADRDAEGQEPDGAEQPMQTEGAGA